MLRGIEDDGRVIVLRPEKLRLHADVSAVPVGHGYQKVRVLQSIYLGSGWKHEIVLPDGTTGVVRDAGTTRFRAADVEAVLSWHPDDAVILDDVTSTAAEVSTQANIVINRTKAGMNVTR